MMSSVAKVHTVPRWRCWRGSATLSRLELELTLLLFSRTVDGASRTTRRSEVQARHASQ